MQRGLLALSLVYCVVLGVTAFWLNGEREVLAGRIAGVEQRAAAAETARNAAEVKLGEAAAVKSALDGIRDRQLHLIYPNLRRFTGQTLAINEKYLSSVELAPPVRNAGLGDDAKTYRDCSFVYENKSDKEASPSVTLFFFNEYGIITGEASDRWMIQTVKPGERRVEKRTVCFEHGEPMYWRVEVR